MLSLVACCPELAFHETEWSIAPTAPAMDKQNRFPQDQFPTTDYLSAAIKKLPHANSSIPPQTVEIDAGAMGRYRVTFVARQNTARRTSTWFWGVESGERIQAGQVGAAEELRDPD